MAGKSARFRGENLRGTLVPMMSVRVVHAGDGYAYLLRSVATADEPTGTKTRLGDYYDAKGTPPGQWFGTGIESLDSDSVRQGRTVGQDAMAALYGEGLHPDADSRIEAGESISDVQLGRAYPIYDAGHPVLAEIKAAEKRFRAEHERRPDEEERNSIALDCARPHYPHADGGEPASGREILAWVNEVKQSVRQATSAYDLTFSPAKSISVLWALADDDTRKRIESIHARSVDDSLRWIEQNALRTRCEVRGVKQLTATKGMIAAKFTHYDTRTGDPDLHTHCLVSNKVQGMDGKWRSVDGQTLLRNAVTASERYNAMMIDRLGQELGVAFDPREVEEGKVPVWEIAGLPTRLNDAFSRRREGARERFEELATTYREKHGRAPSRRAGYALWQQAILDTRDRKAEARSLGELRRQWRTDAAQTIGSERMLDEIVTSSLGKSEHRPAFPSVDDPAFSEGAPVLADRALELVTSRRAEFALRHLDTATNQILHGFTFADDEHRAAAHRQVFESAKTKATRLNAAIEWQLPDALISSDGVAVDRDQDYARFTSRKVLNDENRVLNSAFELTAHLVPNAAIDAALERHRATKGFALNTGQEALVRHLAGSGAQTAAGVGPAGTGKTASMAVLADVWRSQDRQVIALAPSAAAAKQLGGDISATGHTLASLTYRWRGKVGDRPGDVSALGVHINPGDLLLVDEAGMATTDDLAAVTEIASATGAVVRMVGDPYQLDAVETGGLFRTLCKKTNAVELDAVMRFGDDAEQSESGLKIRHGDTSGLDLYERRGWIHEGTRQSSVYDAAMGYLSDQAAGKKSLLVASTNQDVNDANAIIRNALLDAGVVSAGGRKATLTHGHATKKDLILARRNQTIAQPDGTDVRILNGQRLTVAKVHRDGSLSARLEERNRLVHLPADYVRSHVQLGYASTIHRAQGATVDVCRAVVDSSTDRRGLYVALTRGKKQNHLYAVNEARLDESLEDAHLHMSGDDDAPSAREMLDAVVRADSGQESATDLRDRMERDEFSSKRAERLYKAATNRLADDFSHLVVTDMIDHLPVAIADAITDGQRARLATAVASCALAGVDVRESFAELMELHGDEIDPAAVLHSRILAQMPERRPTLPQIAPATTTMDTDLALFAHDTYDRITTDRQGDDIADRLDQSLERHLSRPAAPSLMDSLESALREHLGNGAEADNDFDDSSVEMGDTSDGDYYEF